MKILLFLIPSLTNNGVAKNILAYLESMDQTGIEFDVITANDIDEEIGRRYREVAGEVYAMNLRYKNPIQHVNRLRKLVKKNRYDIVHVHGSSSLLFLELLAAKLGGCHVRIAHSRNTMSLTPKTDRLFRSLFYRLCTARFACGREAGEFLFSGRDFTIISNGKDVQKFSYDPDIREEYRRRYGLTEKWAVGHVGFFGDQKNHSFLVETFKHIYAARPDAYLVLVGDGDNRRNIEQQVAEAGLSDAVMFTGRINDVPEMLQAMDIMMLPSLYEGLPNVVIEWQIAGLPCLISDMVTRECAFTDLAEYLPLEVGVQAWADKLLSMPMPDRESSREAIAEMTDKAGYNIHANARRLKELYTQLVFDKSKRRERS